MTGVIEEIPDFLGSTLGFRLNAGETCRTMDRVLWFDMIERRNRPQE